MGTQIIRLRTRNKTNEHLPFPSCIVVCGAKCVIFTVITRKFVSVNKKIEFDFKIIGIRGSNHRRQSRLFLFCGQSLITMIQLIQQRCSYTVRFKQSAVSRQTNAFYDRTSNRRDAPLNQWKWNNANRMNVNLTSQTNGETFPGLLENNCRYRIPDVTLWRRSLLTMVTLR